MVRVRVRVAVDSDGRVAPAGEARSRVRRQGLRRARRTRVEPSSSVVHSCTAALCFVLFELFIRITFIRIYSTVNDRRSVRYD
jgi:hypothetical protein